MIYGYARVSTDAQDLTSQLAQLRAAVCERCFARRSPARPPTGHSLRSSWPPSPTAMSSSSRPLTAFRATRPACLLVIARDMQRAGAGLRSIAEPVVDTTSEFAELGLAMLGVAAKLERRRIAERAARAAAPMRRPRA
jgi:DNA invertase Pin-like site-specific DNA recombinase